MTKTDSTEQKTATKPATVLIMEGGQVGLSFALLLAHQGILSVLIEKNRYPNQSPDGDMARTQYLDSRNTALSRRTVQIYEQIGLWESLKSHACRIDEVSIYEQNGFGRASLKKRTRRDRKLWLCDGKCPFGSSAFNCC